MCLTIRFSFIIIASAIALLLGIGCGEEDKPDLEVAPRLLGDNWILTGRVSNVDYAKGEVFALGMDGTRYRSQIARDKNFGLELPGNASYALYFLKPSSFRDKQAVNGSDRVKSVSGPRLMKRSPAILRFEESPDIGIRESLRLPKVIYSRNLYLGEIDVKNNEAFATINPATALDFDGDGLNDFTDQDDQNDGLPDYEQEEFLDRIEICHQSSRSNVHTSLVSLPQLFEHIAHGDKMGGCHLHRDEPKANLNRTTTAPKAPRVPEVEVAVVPQSEEAVVDEIVHEVVVNPRADEGVMIEETPDEEGDEEGIDPYRSDDGRDYRANSGKPEEEDPEDEQEIDEEEEEDS